MSDWTSEAISQIDDLLREHDELRARAKNDDLSDLAEAETLVLAGRFQAALERLAPQGTAYWKDAETARHQGTNWRLLMLAATAKALSADLARGWVRTVTELIHADTFSDMLEVASELQEKGYKDAAAVIAGTALEVHLRGLGTKYGLSTRTLGGDHKKADALNAELRKAEAYGSLQQKQVTAWLAIRNSAAHGQYSDYEPSEIKRLIEDVTQFIDRFPA